MHPCSVQLQSELETHKVELSKKNTQAEGLGEEVAALTKANHDFYENSAKFREIFERVENLDKEKKMQSQNRDELIKHTTVLRGNCCTPSLR